jgi:peptidoglycan pentaglycine glycine transferase (the first glycine)
MLRGPVCDDLGYMRGALAELKAEAKRRGFIYVEISPDWINSRAQDLAPFLTSAGWIAAGDSRCSLRVDLRPGIEQIQGNFRKIVRYECRRAERVGLEILAMRREELFSDFYEIYLEMAHRKNFLPDDEHHMRHVAHTLLADEMRGSVLLAYYQGMMLGGAIIVRCGSRCWYVWGATKKEGNVNAGHLLQAHAIAWAKQHGCTEYDLGGYQEGATSGPAFFKRGFSDTIVHFLPPHRCVLSPFWYAVARTAQFSHERIGRARVRGRQAKRSQAVHELTLELYKEMK